MHLILKPDVIPNDGPALKSPNLSVTKNLLPGSSCNFGEGVKMLALKLKMDDKTKIMSAFQQAVVENVKYLQAHLPLGRKLLQTSSFLLLR